MGRPVPWAQPTAARPVGPRGHHLIASRTDSDEVMVVPRWHSEPLAGPGQHGGAPPLPVLANQTALDRAVGLLWTRVQGYTTKA
jgi:hypothetical protein